jgi:hypothetical protein
LQEVGHQGGVPVDLFPEDCVANAIGNLHSNGPFRGYRSRNRLSGKLQVSEACMAHDRSTLFGKAIQRLWICTPTNTTSDVCTCDWVTDAVKFRFSRPRKFLLPLLEDEMQALDQSFNML